MRGLSLAAPGGPTDVERVEHSGELGLIGCRSLDKSSAGTEPPILCGVFHPNDFRTEVDGFQFGAKGDKDYDIEGLIDVQPFVDIEQGPPGAEVGRVADPAGVRTACSILRRKRQPEPSMLSVIHAFVLFHVNIVKQ